MSLSVVSESSLQVEWAPPASDGGAPIAAYLVEWDPDPGQREVQVVQTNVNLGANEVQTVQTLAAHVDEVQTVTTTATVVPEVQSITTSAAPGEVLGGVFTLVFDTTASGGSRQRSGVIGYNAPASGDRSGVFEILNAMSNIGPAGVQSVSRSTVDAQGGYTWLVTFAAAMGDVPALTLDSNFLTGSGANVVLNTPTNGNIISGGTFTLGFRGATTAGIANDATDVDMQQALEALASIDTVRVRRVGPSNQHGYVWWITFTSWMPLNTGDLPLMTVGTNLLAGTGANVAVNQITAGNQLTGTFQLSYGGVSTTDLAWNCDAATMKTALTALSIGTLDVSRAAAADPQGGFTWTISFLTLKGSLSALVGDPTNLGETRSDGVVSKQIIVTRTRPGTVQEVQTIAVTTTALTVSSSTYFWLQVSFASQVAVTGPIPANAMGDGTCMPTQPEIQQIQVTTVDTTAIGGDNLVSNSAVFQLLYTSNTEGGATAITNLIAFNSAMGDCSVGAALIKQELEALDLVVGTVSVAFSATLATQACTWTVTFTNQSGNLVPMQVITPGNGAGPANTVTIGDDTVTVTTIKDGTINIIKTELEKLANVGQVTVTASPAVTPNAAQTCTWSVTFDGNAGNLPLMAVSVDSAATFGASKTTSGDSITIASSLDGTSTVLGGTFALDFRGQRTGYMPFDVSATVLQNQLEVLSTIGSVAVTRSNADPNNGYAWTVSFLNDLGDLDAIVPDAMTLTGTAPCIQVSEAVKGISPPFNSKDPVNGKLRPIFSQTKYLVRSRL